MMRGTVRISFVFPAACLAALAAAPCYGQPASGIPHLEKHGAATQLIVGGQPFLALAGELGNNTATSLENMQPLWPKRSEEHTSELQSLRHLVCRLLLE